MDIVLRGRQITEDDLSLVQKFIHLHWSRGRKFISQEICRHWAWRQPNGALKDAACRAILLKLEAQGLVCLPARQTGGIGRRRKKSPATQLLLLPPTPPSPLEGGQALFGHVQWRIALSGAEFSLYKELMDRHHYLGWRPAVGHTLRYIAYAQDQPVGCLGWSAATWKVAVRDHWIGWSEAVRQKNLYQIVNNTRFLVLERIPHLASHLLARNIRRLSMDWQRFYGYSPLLLETFVDTTRFQGTCYKAANWIYLGLTQGRGKWDRYNQHPETVKAIYSYPLCRDFRSKLCHG